MVEIIAQHDRPPFDRLRENGVVIEFGSQLTERRLKRGHVLEPAFGELFEHRQPGAIVGLGEHHVETDDGNAEFIE